MKQANSSSAPTGRPQHQNKLLVTWPWRHRRGPGFGSHCPHSRAGAASAPSKQRPHSGLAPPSRISPPADDPVYWLICWLFIIYLFYIWLVFAPHLAAHWAMNHVSSLRSIRDSQGQWTEILRRGRVASPLKNTWILRPYYVAWYVTTLSIRRIYF